LPLGLEGYCPVALIDQSKWLKGDPRWGIVHRGRTYLFFSAEAKERFWANPDRYSPALSGLDTVILADRGDHREGSRNHGLVYRDRVYLFSSEESLQQFVRSPQRYADYVRQATAAADGRGERR
jgi:YHS domain-containing protein